jgi:hypothetical protein
MSNDLIKEAEKLLYKKNSWNRGHNIEMESSVNEDIMVVFANMFGSLNEDQIEEDFERINSILIARMDEIGKKYSLSEEQLEAHVNIALNEILGALAGGALAGGALAGAALKSGAALGKGLWSMGKGLAKGAVPIIKKGIEAGKGLLKKGAEAGKAFVQKHPKVASALGGLGVGVGASQLAKKLGEPASAAETKPSTGSSATPSTSTAKPAEPAAPKPAEPSKAQSSSLDAAEKELRSHLEKRDAHTGIGTADGSRDKMIQQMKSDPRAEQTFKNYIEMQKKENSRLGVPGY